MNNLINIIAKLSDIMGRMEDRAREQYNTTGLSLTQMHYLETIGHLDNPSLTELSAALNLSKPTVTVAIDKLIEKGCVYKVRSDHDRRTTHLHLTENGRLLNQMHDFAHQSIAELFTKNLSQKETEQLIEIIDKAIR
ncbi:MAG: MarR family transcriptional regulator [Bacteroidales bacterium]|jgi:DNA-binding MarR family transcriptional regulator